MVKVGKPLVRVDLEVGKSWAEMGKTGPKWAKMAKNCTISTPCAEILFTTIYHLYGKKDLSERPIHGPKSPFSGRSGPDSSGHTGRRGVQTRQYLRTSRQYRHRPQRNPTP